VLKKMPLESLDILNESLSLIFIIISIGGALNSMVPSTALTLIIFRTILILSAIGFYGAFILPKWLKRILLKQSISKL
jgi:hypothetical protein